MGSSSVERNTDYVPCVLLTSFPHNDDINMVKADVRRDYYADLGLAPSAESEEIKKQFRKLG